jgi:hypothetical protein
MSRRDVARLHNPKVSARMTGGGKDLQPPRHAEKSAERRAGNPRSGDLQDDLTSDPPVLPQPGVADVQAPGRQVLAE